MPPTPSIPPRDPVDAAVCFDPVILGLWPIAGITSGAVSDHDALATLDAAIEAGIRTFDTAYSYGYQGQSDRLLGRAIAGRREAVQVIGKVGQRWTPDARRVVDGTPARIVADTEQSLRRIGIERFDLLMLHAVDPAVPVRESAETLAALRERGRARTVGICNATTDQLEQFAAVCAPAAIQCPLNMLQRGPLQDVIPWCHQRQVGVHVYWVLMKGILAGRITRDHAFGPGDSRPTYPIYQGAQRERTHALVDRLRGIAADAGMTVGQLAIGWALSQPGVTAALVGAKRPEQIRETAQARPLPDDLRGAVQRLLDPPSFPAGAVSC